MNNSKTQKTRMNREDMEIAVRMWREDDPGLDKYLTDHGISHIGKWKQNQKVRYGKPEVVTLGDAMNGMKEATDMFFDQIPFKCIATTMEYKTTGISTPIGDWQYIKKAGYLDWTTLSGETISMSLEEWKELMKLFPEVLKVLEVEL